MKQTHDPSTSPEDVPRKPTCVRLLHLSDIHHNSKAERLTAEVESALRCLVKQAHDNAALWGPLAYRFRDEKLIHGDLAWEDVRSAGEATPGSYRVIHFYGHGMAGGTPNTDETSPVMEQPETSPVMEQPETSPVMEQPEQAGELDPVRSRVFHTFSSLGALVPQRISDEEVGDALERIDQMIRDGRRSWWIYLKVVATCFWVVVHAVHASLRGVSAKKSAASKKRSG